MLDVLGFEQRRLNYIGRKSVHSFCTGAGTDYKEQNTELWNTFETEILQ
jgi:hypothetical protein